MIFASSLYLFLRKFFGYLIDLPIRLKSYSQSYLNRRYVQLLLIASAVKPPFHALDDFLENMRLAFTKGAIDEIAVVFAI